MTGLDRFIGFLQQSPKDDASGQPPTRHLLSPTAATILGRDPRCQIVIDPDRYRAVSRRHAEVSPVVGFESPSGGRFWQLCDLNSANGTFINGQRLQGCRVLQVGDRIVLGLDGPEFVFECETSSSASPPPASAKPSLPNTPPRKPTPATARGTLPPPPEPDRVSLTQLFPIFSTGRELSRKAYLLPAGVTIGCVVLLFIAVGQPLIFNLLLAAYLASAAYYFIYLLCGKHKPWWLLVGVALMTVLLLLSPVLDLFIFVFRQVLPGTIPPSNASVSFPVLLIRMFFGAGLMEELLKALPIFAVYGLGRCLRPPWRVRLGVWEPLDGILIGAASAVGFTLMETLGQYLPDIYNATIAAGEEAAQLAKLQLLIPRVLGSVAGHMAYTGYFGYFIGLSVLRRRRRWLVLGVGYLTAAGLHALWNAAGELSPVFLALVGLLSYAFLTAAILKARELSPTRSQNFATRFFQ
jgi:RsiW-degrading membrane proteinase PrsW (M82 family)